MAAPAVAFVLITGLCVAGAVARLVNTTAASTADAVASSSWNDGLLPNARRARINTVLSIGDELLVELRCEGTCGSEAQGVVWLHGTTTAWTIATLARWRDAGAVVGFDCRPEGTLVRASRSALALPKVHGPGVG